MEQICQGQSPEKQESITIYELRVLYTKYRRRKKFIRYEELSVRLTELEIIDHG